MLPLSRAATLSKASFKVRYEGLNEISSVPSPSTPANTPRAARTESLPANKLDRTQSTQIHVPFHGYPAATNLRNVVERLSKNATAIFASAFVVVVIFFSVLLAVNGGLGIDPTVQDPDYFPVLFTALGDWGRNGTGNQTKVADALAKHADYFTPNFIVGLGNNFYPGLRASGDPTFGASFSTVYKAPSLQVPWHFVLGNVDYGNCDEEPCHHDEHCEHSGASSCVSQDCCYSPLHELDVELTKKDSRWHCERFFHISLARGEVLLLFIDTSPFIDGYMNQTWSHYPGGLARQSWAAQLKEIEGRLASSNATWKVVFGHHPIRSDGPRGDTVELVNRLEPVLLQYGVQLYISAHDRNLQHTRALNSSLHHFVAGSGAIVDGPEVGGSSPVRSSLMHLDESGFISVDIERNEAFVQFFTISGREQPEYRVRISR